MIKYCELSQPQKDLFNLMNKGYVLSYHNGIYTIYDGRYTRNVRTDTANSLRKRHFILENFRDGDMAQYCINIDVLGRP